MPKTTLEQWRMFKAVVDAGGFNQAAVVVHKSPSSIHHAISKLEESLGITLFDVQGRKTQLTLLENCCCAAVSFYSMKSNALKP